MNVFYRRGFTAVELLVVIVIIMVLVSMLMPVVKQARETAVMTTCLSNLRQCELGFESYAGESRTYMPYTRVWNGNIHLWSYFMVGGYSPFDDSQTNVTWIDKRVSLCPSNFYYSVDRTTAGNHNYAYALYFPGNESAARGKVMNTDDNIAASHDAYFFRTESLSTPGAIVMLGDSYTNHPSTANGGGHMMANYNPNSYSNWSGGIQLIHFDRANTLFFDGHGGTYGYPTLRNDTVSQLHYFFPSNGIPFTLP